MLNSKTLKITDDSGFLGIVNPNTYKSFVSKDWELSQLFNHFVDEINKDHLILWSTDSGNVWTLSFVNKPSEVISFREFYKAIEVTSGKVFLTNYDDLTMAAQYSDEVIPSKHNADLYIDLDNGWYKFQIRQLFDPKDYNFESGGQVNFEVVVTLEVNKKSQQVDKVFWLTK